MRPKKHFYQINHYIKAPQLRVIDTQGQQIGILSKQEALRLAHQKGVDLVEIAPKANPPVAKLIDFKKFQYLQNKKKRQTRKKSKSVDLKEIRFSPFIADQDLLNRLSKAEQFLNDGHRVKIVIKFAGRQITRKEFGHQLIDKILNHLHNHGLAEGPAKLQGKKLFVIINPKKTHS